MSKLYSSHFRYIPIASERFYDKEKRYVPLGTNVGLERGLNNGLPFAVRAPYPLGHSSGIILFK